MLIKDSKTQPLADLNGFAAEKTSMRVLVGPDDGAPTFSMRKFSIEPGGYTPQHGHDYEHEVYILKGQGEVRGVDETQLVSEGDVVFVKPDELHQFVNVGATEPLEFICIIPNQE